LTSRLFSPSNSNRGAIYNCYTIAGKAILAPKENAGNSKLELRYLPAA
jgi:hypothetical protein